MEVAIIGGAGHVGFPMGLVLTDVGHDVTLIDTDEAVLDRIMEGEVPYLEPGSQSLLTQALSDDLLDCATTYDGIAEADVIIIVLGTPIDEHHNPEMDNLLGTFGRLEPHLQDDQLIVLRSTVYPGTTEKVRNELESFDLSVGEDIFLVFAPERVAQHNAIEEIVELPQLVGSFEGLSFSRAESFFETFLSSDCLPLYPTEAELGKLYTNMWRYLTFAAANEFFLIADSFAEHHTVNIHRILERTERDYPRFDVPSPGANVGGPCLTKDGWFLVDNIPFGELVSVAFQINEGMPAQIINKMHRYEPDPEKITILGMTFKANSDDTRNSVAFKFRKQLEMKGYANVVEIEPNVDGFDDWADIEGSEWVILTTPHDEFSDLERINDRVGNPECIYCDVWGFWEQTKFSSRNGYFYGNAIDQPVSEVEWSV